MSELIHVSYAKGYRFGGVTFEWHNYLGPFIINRHTEKERDFRNISMRNWSQVNKFSRLSVADREKHRIY